MAAPQMPYIEKLYAYLSVDEDGDEGLCAFMGPDGNWMPMVCADQARVENLRPFAEGLVRRAPSGTRIRLAEFTQRTDVEWIE